MKSSPTNISIIGLGSMGSALAKTLLKSNSEVSVWNRTLSKAKELNHKEANICLSPKEAIENSELIIVCLLNYKVWSNIIDSHLTNIDLNGKTIIQLTTGSVEEVLEHNEWVKKHHGNLLEGAILCLPSQIGTKDSSIIVSGNKKVINDYQHVITNLSPVYTNLGSNLITPTVLSRAMISGILGSLVGMMNGVALCQKANISLDDFKTIYFSRNSIIEEEGKRIIEAIKSENTIDTEASISAWGHGQEALLSVSKSLNSNLDFQLALNNLFKQAIKLGLKDHDLSAMVKVFEK
jgi:3-hydroxyisobutyrate dehydrogenase-like beta-hydroxyacid dehydrogenase